MSQFILPITEINTFQVCVFLYPNNIYQTKVHRTKTVVNMVFLLFSLTKRQETKSPQQKTLIPLFTLSTRTSSIVQERHVIILFDHLLLVKTPIFVDLFGKPPSINLFIHSFAENLKNHHIPLLHLLQKIINLSQEESFGKVF